MRKAAIFLLSIALSIEFAGNAVAHEDAETLVEPHENSGARLFTADAANGDIIAVNLPEGKVIARLSTPPYIIYLALGKNKKNLYAMRGTGRDRDWVTVIDTGFTEHSDEVKPPYIARSFVGNVPDGVQHGHTASVRGKDAIIMEGDGELIIFDKAEFSGFGEVSVRRFPLASVDHYAFVDAGDYLYIGYLGRGMVQVLDSDTGNEVTRITGCPILHGKTKDPTSGRVFFGCQRHAIAIGTKGDEAHKVVARIEYPDEQRVGNFHNGKDQVIWGYTEDGVPKIHRLDAGKEPYRFDVLPIERSIRQGTSEDGEYLFVLTFAGVFEIRDGGTGELLHSMQVSGPFPPDLKEKVDRAVNPDIKTWGDHVYVSLPHEGRILDVDLATGTIYRYLDTDGEPTRLIIVSGEHEEQGEQDHENGV
ncbi:MAG: hypothetical protein VX533_05065 [Pseudomonadota bacterium]|nr:hypothetical protein [Pseudomonadota bacterium]